MATYAHMITLFTIGVVALVLALSIIDRFQPASFLRVIQSEDTTTYIDDSIENRQIPRYVTNYTECQKIASHRDISNAHSNRPYNRSHIAFIKTHKCASSTLQAILIRYGIRRNLTFALSKDNRNQIGWPTPFDRWRHLKPTGERPPDILCHHSVLSSSTLNTLPNDSFYLTVTRDPYSQIKSSYEYFGLDNCFRTKNKSAPAISLLELIDKKVEICRNAVLKNPQMFDLGMPFVMMEDDVIIQKWVDYLDGLFHLVIVTDYFDESLIFLRDMLNMTNSDILNFKINFKGEEKPGLSGLLPDDTEENRAKIYTWLKADHALYKHFKRKLEAMISKQKQYIERQVKELRYLQNKWLDYCVKEVAPASKIKDIRFRPYGVDSYGYILTKAGVHDATCVDLATVELYRHRQLSEYNANV